MRASCHSRAFVFACLGLVTLPVAAVHAQSGFVANYDEEKVPRFTLPDPLVRSDGKRIASADEWQSVRRNEILELFTDQMFGRVPEGEVPVSHEVVSTRRVFGGRAIRKQIRLTVSGKTDGPIHVLVHLPTATDRKVPVFVGLNFSGNHTVHSDPDILISKQWMRPSRDDTVVDNRATEKGRGKSSSRWPVEAIVERGYGIVTAYYGDIDPDYDDGFKNGVHAAFAGSTNGKMAPDAWGSIAAWAWGLSRIVDFLETDPAVDSSRIALMGHSRLGKTSLWAGATDQRFAIVISNNSGCGGAALSKRAFGETVGRINTSFPHWFNDNFQKYNLKEASLPFDQHMLIALIAPRPVLVCSAEEDRWADPRGEFLAAKAADGVYRLLGTDGMQSDRMPGLSEPVRGTVGYRIRAGKHDVTPADWQAYMDFADLHFKGD